MRLLLLVAVLFAVPTAVAQGSAAPSSVGDRIRLAASGWDGTQYRFGGTRISGIDCSALMVSWFDHLFDIRLPRTSNQQFRVGTEVEPGRVAEGDLVFFGSPSSITHVGVYVGQGEFAHASTSGGVTVSSMSQDYWSTRYRGARRVLDGVRPEMPRMSRPAVAFTAPSPQPEEPIAEAPAERAGAPTFTTSTTGKKQKARRRIGW